MEHITQLSELIAQMPVDAIGVSEQDRTAVIEALNDPTKTDAERLTLAQAFFAKLQQAMTTWHSGQLAKADAEFDSAVKEAEEELQKTLAEAEQATQKLIDDATASLGSAQ